MSPSANEYQIGGNHYKTGYEHWDFVIKTDMGYLAGNATKYIARHRKKNGLADLEKALHYVNKLIETSTVRKFGKIAEHKLRKEVVAFADVNELDKLETEIILMLTIWETQADLQQAASCIATLMEPDPVPLEDSNKHATRE